MNKVVILTTIALLVLLAACGDKQMDAKPLKSTPTAAVVIAPAASEPEPVESAPETAPAVEESSGVTAAEAIQELQNQIQTTSSENTGAFYPEAPEGVTGTDALHARTKALMQQSSDIDLGGEADADEERTLYNNLPSDYGNSKSAGE